MKHSESIASIAKALAAAQGVMLAARKDRKNPYYNSTYADLASVIDAMREPFAKNGLSYSQGTIPSEKPEVTVITMLMHESGEWLESALTMPVKKDDAQGYGIAISYARRYALQAICGQAAEDDDGNTASGKNENGNTGQKPTSEEGQLRAVPKAPPSSVIHPQNKDTAVKRPEPAKPENGNRLPETHLQQPASGFPWHQGVFKGGMLGDPGKSPDQIAIKTPSGNEHTLTFWSRPQVLKEYEDWTELVNKPCRFQVQIIKKENREYKELRGLEFPDLPPKQPVDVSSSPQEDDVPISWKN